MLAATVAVVTVAALCLAFGESRWIGAVAASVIAYLHPLSLLAVVAVAAVAAALFIHHRRRSSHAHGESDH